MKEKTYRIFTVISCIISVACLVKINGLQTEINRMENNLRNQISNVDSSVRNIYSTPLHPEYPGFAIWTPQCLTPLTLRYKVIL